MLSTKALIDAKMDTSGNELLKSIYEGVVFFNSGGVAKNDQGDYLERLLVGVGTWLTSHPPKTTQTNTKRWEAMEDLADQIAEEMRRLGLRTLAGPSDWKKIGEHKGTGSVHNVHRSYWLEMLSPQHGVGFQLSPKFKDWKQNGLPGQSFWDYVQMNPPYGARYVQYYDAVAAEAYRMEFRADGKLCRVHDGSEYDTTGLETCASGDGWAIFVLSPEGKLYSHKHVEGVFHHSSFLSGSAVVAAGEMLVVGGIVRVVNAKSGHYLPLPENMANFVKQMMQLPKDAIILPDFSANPPPAYRIQEYRFNPKSPATVKRAALEAKLTPTADNPQARTWINKVAA
jgi:hypothetical protein